jgi:hypothetical protein
LTTPKIKDLVHAPSRKYREIESVLSSPPPEKRRSDLEDIQQLLEKKTYPVVMESNTVVPVLHSDMDSMKHELKQFLQEKIKNKERNENIQDRISQLESYSFA